MEGPQSASAQPAMTPQQQLYTNSSRSPLSLYRDLAVGDAGIAFLLWYEAVTTLCGGLPGLLGLASRSFLYPGLFASCGARPAFGRGIQIRNTTRISLGKKLIVDDYCCIDARGLQSAIVLGDHVTIGRFSILAAKNAQITLGNGVNIGSSCRIATQSQVHIGDSTLIGAYSYIGPGNHQQGDEDTPLIARDMEIKGGVTIGKHVWIGARATILDGVTIGDNAIVGAHALVRDDVPAGATVVGAPARVVK
jgi:serine acetyltransferase